VLPRPRIEEASRQGVIRVRGTARVNGRPAAPGMPVRIGDELTTSAGSELTVVVDADALLLRSNARIKLGSDEAGAIYFLRVLSGAVLAVFAPGRRKELRTATAVIGIRGTGAYVAAERDRTYVCICYGTAELSAIDDAAAAETVTTRHHDEPRYIYRRGMPKMIDAAPVVDHSDEELVMLEALVGRRPPFAGNYQARVMPSDW
jgi:hypothetical protein